MEYNWERTAERLEELKDMQDGWLDGDGLAPDVDGLERLKGLFKKHYTFVRHPYIYPHNEDDADLSIEWSFPDFEVGMDLDLKTMKGDVLRCSMVNSAYWVYNLNLNRPEEWARLCSILKMCEKQET